MNLAYYDAKSRHMDPNRESFDGMTPDDVRQFVPLLQLHAIEEGDPFDGFDLLIAWEDSPSKFLSVFTLGDPPPGLLTKDLLDTILTQARAQ